MYRPTKFVMKDKELEKQSKHLERFASELLKASGFKVNGDPFKPTPIKHKSVKRVFVGKTLKSL